MDTLSSELELSTDRRYEKRSRTLKSGKLIYGAVSPTVIDCLVIEMSDGGTRVETSVMTGIPEVFSLQLNDNIERRARRCWANGNQIGIEFLPTPHGSSDAA